MNVYHADVAVVGGGAAGIWAAAAAQRLGAEAVLLDKGHAGYSGSSFYFLNRSWGYQTVLPTDPPGTRDAMIREILHAGGDEVDPGRAAILVDESWPQLEELLRCGARLRMAGGIPIRVRGCFGDRETAVCVEDHRRAFRKIARSIPKMERWTALRILVESGRTVGLWGVNSRGGSEMVLARAVILATGGAAGLYRRFLGDPGGLGLGYALASEAGAKLRGLEFIQFMLARSGKKYPEFFACNEMAAGGAVPEPLLEEELRRLLPSGLEVDRVYGERARHFPFSTRDASLYFDAAVAHARRPRVWRRKDSMMVPLAVHGAKRRGLNHGRDRYEEVFHAAHAFNGGIETDEWGRTSVEGLYGVGEAAGGIHGADRLGGTMIPACLVFGRRAGECAAREALSLRAAWEGGAARGVVNDCLSLSMTQRTAPGRRGREDRIDPSGPAVPGASWMAAQGAAPSGLFEVQNAMSQAVGVVRTRQGLEQGIETLRSILDQNSYERSRSALSWSAHITRLAAIAGIKIAEAALERTESKGPHYRADSAH